MRIIDYVDPRIGTTGSGKAIVGPQMPHGMCKLSPDTRSLPNAGYDYRDTRISCFSHTHLEGVGGRGGRGIFGIMPTVGPVKTNEYDYGSAYSHEQETAKVGYYSVLLEDYGIRAELAAALHSGLHTYTFPKSDEAHIIFDAGHTTGLYNRTKEAHLERIGNNALQGWGIYPPCADSSLSAPSYFYLEFSKDFDSAEFYDADPEDQEILDPPALKLGLSTYNKVDIRGRVKAVGDQKADSNRALGVFNFRTEEGEKVCVRIGISFISIQQAKENLRSEIRDFDMLPLITDCELAWEKTLSCIQAEDSNERKKKIFYSALYRALNQPTEYTEYGKFCIASDGTDKVVYTDRKFYADDWAIWDTFRSTNPLQVLMEPERTCDIIQSLVEYYKDSGWLPTCPAPARGVNCAMVGHNYDSMIADAWAKGCRNFDVELAFEAMRKAATDYSTGYGIKAAYKDLGYIPANTAIEEDFCITETAEYIYADWCTAQMAKALGREEDYRYFSERAQNYRKMFDPETGLFRRRHADGRFVEPFDTNACFKHGYTESSPWESTFFVPHDAQGLINLFGSREAFINQLDMVYKLNRHNFENETSLHLPFMYIYAGKPSRTADIVRDYLVPTFTDEPDGLYGEDDNGAMSAFNAFSWMGIFPLCPGTPEYVLFSPYLEGWSITNPDGSVFRVKTENNSDKNRYMQSATLNGQPYRLSYITHDTIRKGGELVIVMGDTPSDYGTDPATFPHSESAPELTDYVPSGKTLWSDLRSDHMVMPEDRNAPFRVSVEVYNDRREQIKEKAVLTVDGQEKMTRDLVLPAQDKHRETFELLLEKGKPHEISVNGCEPILLEVCGAPDYRYITFANTPAYFYQGKRHLYIEAAGDQGMEHFGEIFLRDPVKGDFDVTVTVDYKDVSSPYAPAGIVIRNEINDPIRYGFKGGMYMGCMCMRGFYSYLGGEIGCDETGTHWAMGAPRIPCYLKIEKRGKRFKGYYSNDGINWSLKSCGNIPDAWDEQYVGIYSRSCIHEKKLARFDGGIRIEKK